MNNRFLYFLTEMLYRMMLVLMCLSCRLRFCSCFHKTRYFLPFIIFILVKNVKRGEIPIWKYPKNIKNPAWFRIKPDFPILISDSYLIFSLFAILVGKASLCITTLIVLYFTNASDAYHIPLYLPVSPHEFFTI